MIRSVADRALYTIGEHGGVIQLASGMSSTAWRGTVSGTEYVVRVPVGDGRRPTPDYAAEARLLADLSARGAPVAVTRLVRIDDHDCAIAPCVDGRPIRPVEWSDDVVRAVADFFTVLHATPPDLAVEPDVVRRFHLASIWPFDGSELTEHPIGRIWPERIHPIQRRRRAIEAAAGGPTTVVHTDLHAKHLLVDDVGSLVGILDFGDSFPGVAAWDHACVRYYHGDDVQRRVADELGPGAPSPHDVDALSIAWALYKLGKTPGRIDIVERVDRLLTTAGC